MEHSRLAQVQGRKPSILIIIFLSLNIFLILYLITQSHIDKTKINGLLNGEYFETKKQDL